MIFVLPYGMEEHSEESMTETTIYGDSRLTLLSMTLLQYIIRITIPLYDQDCLCKSFSSQKRLRITYNSLALD